RRRAPPRSPPSPYTTPFRSRINAGHSTIELDRRNVRNKAPVDLFEPTDARIADLSVSLQRLPLATIGVEVLDRAFRSRYPLRRPFTRDLAKIPRPQLPVVWKHEMLGNSPSKLLDEMLLEVLGRRSIPVDVAQAFLARLNYLGIRKLVKVLLERIGDQRSMRVYAGVTLLQLEGSAHEPLYQLEDFRMRGMKRVSADIEHAPGMRDGPAQSADRVLFLQNQRISLQRIGHRQPRRPAANDQSLNVLHHRRTPVV